MDISTKLKALLIIQKLTHAAEEAEKDMFKRVPSCSEISRIAFKTGFLKGARFVLAEMDRQED